MNTERFDFTGSAGHRLAGLLDLPDGPPHAVALFAHCFTCTRNSLAAVRVSRALVRRGMAVLRFDFTGLGQSEGDFADSTFSGDVHDLLAAGDALAVRLSRPDLLVGHSLGGAAVLAAAGDMRSVRAVATIGAPFEPRHVALLLADGVAELLAQGEARVDIGGRPFKLRRTFLEDLERQDPAGRLRTLARPLLVLHATRDETVDIVNAQSIFQAAIHPKSFVSLADADHLLTRTRDASYAADVIAAWASRYLEPEKAAL